MKTNTRMRTFVSEVIDDTVVATLTAEGCGEMLVSDVRRARKNLDALAAEAARYVEGVESWTLIAA